MSKDFKPENTLYKEIEQIDKTIQDLKDQLVQYAIPRNSATYKSTQQAIKVLKEKKDRLINRAIIAN